MDLSQLADYLIRQQRGELSPEETAEFKTWYEASEANRTAYLRYATLLKAQAIEHERAAFGNSRQAAWKRVERQLKATQTHRNLFDKFARYIIAACVAFVAGWWCAYEFTGTHLETVGWQTIETPLGAKSHICLPDGSTVWLNSGSRLSYSPMFGQTDRRLQIDGEGYFEVSRNESLPFSIRTQSGTIARVLGTKFNLKAYSGDLESKITLLEGSLTVYADTLETEGYTMHPNEQVVIDQQTHAWKVHEVKAETYMAWTALRKEEMDANNIKTAANNLSLPDMTVPTSTMRNILFFDEEPLNQIVRDLGRAFNVHIKIAETDSILSQEKYYGDFRNGESIYEIMDIITSGDHLSYKIENNTIIIYQKTNHEKQEMPMTKN